MGEDDPQKALGAVQDAPKGTGEQGNSAVEKGILRCGLPQAQCTAFGPVSYTHLDVYKRQVQHDAAGFLLPQPHPLLRGGGGQLFAITEADIAGQGAAVVALSLIHI